MEKLGLKDIFKDGKIPSQPIKIDWEARKIQLKQAQQDWDERKLQEQQRMADMQCPVCKSSSKTHILKSINNGVMGPGYSSRITDDHYSCNKCGVHYTDVNKVDIGKYPNNIWTI